MDDVRSRLVEQLAWEMTSWNSVHVLVKQSMAEAPLELRQFRDSLFLFDYHETSSGMRKLDTLLKEGGRPTLHYVYAFDGKDYEFVQYKRGRPDEQESVVYGGRSFGTELRTRWTDRPRPLYYYFVGKIPLHEALPARSI